MNAEPQLPKTRDEVEPPSQQFPIGEALKAMAILAVGFACAAPLVQATKEINWEAALFSLVCQTGGLLVGLLVATLATWRYRHFTGPVLGLAYREGYPHPAQALRKQLQLTILAFILALELFAAVCFVLASRVVGPFMFSFGVGMLGGTALYHYRWKHNNNIWEICENGISMSPTQFIPWQQLQVWPGRFSNTVRVAYRGYFPSAPVETFDLHVPPELMDNLLKRYGGDPWADALPKEQP